MNSVQECFLCGYIYPDYQPMEKVINKYICLVCVLDSEEEGIEIEHKIEEKMLLNL